MVKVSCWKSTRAWTYNWYLKSKKIHGLLSNLVNLIQKETKAHLSHKFIRSNPLLTNWKPTAEKFKTRFAPLGIGNI